MPIQETECQVSPSDPAEPSLKMGSRRPLGLLSCKVTKVRRAEGATKWRSSDWDPVSNTTSPCGRQVRVWEAVL